MTSPVVYDPQGQTARRRSTYDTLLPLVTPFFPWEGGAVVDKFPHQGDNRLRLWVAGALLAGSPEEQKLGDGIIRAVYFNHACHFCMAWTFSLLHRFEPLLSLEAVAHLESYVKRYLVDNMTADYHFHGANDNAPAECATAIVLAGERFEIPAYVDFGRERLGDLDFVMDRRGTIFECNSPTYSPATLTAMCDLAEFAQDEQVRAIALRAEQRIWQEIALAFHPSTRQQMGPYSRAYEDDLLQQGTDMTYAIYQALGPIQPTNPMAMLAGEPVPNTLNHNDWDFGRASCLRSATCDYHLAPETADLFLNKPLPLRVSGSNEFMGMAGLPGAETMWKQYFTKHYGVGTFANRPWAGQVTPFSVSVRREEFDPAGSTEEYLASVRHIWARYVVSERFNGMMQRNPEDPAERNRDFLYDSGVGMTIQQDNTIMACYRPANNNKWNADSQIMTMKLSLLFPMHHSNVDEVWIGERQFVPFSAAVEGFAPVYVKDGPVYLGFYPLVLTRQENSLADIMLETQDLYGMISFFNKSGFYGLGWDEKEMATVGNGFVCEISDEEEWGSFAAFREGIFAQAEVSDQLYVTERRTSYRRPGRDFSLAYDVNHHAIRYATIDRQPVPWTQLATEPPVPLVGL
ncbi:MAG TPA: hypothetical protein VGM19_05145 [Armatimonadota bacterium]|jgi:hypothetical protein